MKRWKIDSLEEFEEEIVKCNISKIIDQTNVFESYYKCKIEIPKKKGKREIYVIDKSNSLYYIQKNLKKNFLDNILLSDRAFGFVKEQSYFYYLQEHMNTFSSNYYLRIDIKNFFGSINGDHIGKAFAFYVDGEDKVQIIEYIKKIVLYNDELVQGTPVAPTISNIVFRPLDIRIERFCDMRGVNYSRYADDLLFSTDKEGILNKKFLRTIERILKCESFAINYDKLRASKKTISLNGFVVGKDVRISRKRLKHINGMVYYLEKNPHEMNTEWFVKFNEKMRSFGYNEIEDDNDIINILSGNRAFLLEAKKFGADEQYISHCDKIIKRIEKQIDILCK